MLNFVFGLIFTVFSKHVYGFIILFMCCYFVVAAIIYIFCIFMTYSTSYCCYYKLIDSWNVCARMCVCVWTARFCSWIQPQQIIGSALGIWI